MTSELIPQDIHREGAALHIQWSDGHLGIYPFKELRLACLCANCVDEWTRKPLLRPDKIPNDIAPVSADYVGRYALSIVWTDGHATGIYSFDYLRQICRCPECQKSAL